MKDERGLKSGCSFREEALRRAGFSGFLTFQTLRDCSFMTVPEKPGTYVVLRTKDDRPSFLTKNPGGRHKGRDPTADVAALEAKWISGCEAIYVGKADPLRTRLKQFADFGAGKPVGHWGGRYVWQLEGSGRHVVAWRLCKEDETALGLETQMLHQFRQEHEGRLPFANLRR